MNTNNAILIVGGSGVVGQQIAHLIRQCHPDFPLIIAGINLEKAETFARELKNSTAIAMNVENPKPLNGLSPRIVLSIVNDPHDFLLRDSIAAGVPYIDITRWSERVRSVISCYKAESLRSPIMLSSSWMAGVAAIIAVAVSRQFKRTDDINISVLYSLKDKAGPNSVEYMDRLSTPFEVMLNGAIKKVYPYTDPRKITFPSGYTAKAYRFDTPDQITLPTTIGAKTVACRIAFDNAVATNLLVLLTRSGIWKLISGKFFTSFRRLLLYNPGSGAKHEIVIEVSGIDENNNHKNLYASVVDPKGQTHLVAVGVLIQLERILGIDGAQAPSPGIVYPDSFPQIEHALKALSDQGILVNIAK